MAGRVGLMDAPERGLQAGDGAVLPCGGQRKFLPFIPPAPAEVAP